MQMDLLLGVLRKVSRKRPKLRLVVASATVDVEAFLKFLSKRHSNALTAPERKRPRNGWDDDQGEYHKKRVEENDWRKLCQDLGSSGLGGNESDVTARDVCVVAVEGRVHPVEVHYLEEPAHDYVDAAVSAVMAIHQSQPEGDILVFLTGQQEIDLACSMIKERWHQAKERAPTPQQRPKPLTAFPLHGALSKEMQLKALVKAPRGARKVVVSTNIAEASVTIEGVVYVVDSCLVKLDAHCPHNGTTYLNIGACSRSSSRQRAGRAGRTRPGFCYRLLTEDAFHSSLVPEHSLPEVARTDLKETILFLKCLGVDNVAGFDFVTRPSVETMESALEELYALGAVDEEARVIEPIGPRLAHGPVPLLLMKLMLLAAEPQFSCTSEAAAICAMLSLKDPWLQSTNRDRLSACKASFGVYEGDLVTLLNVYGQYQTYYESDPEWAKRHLLSEALLQRAFRVKRQLEG
mmetsp:Transcript_23890/g.50978  ORF Transcript_23890/g.50978 Transcript_23890/m.50978 type:complete len:463 (+) Transcript_23890:1-1389(+)